MTVCVPADKLARIMVAQIPAAATPLDFSVFALGEVITLGTTIFVRCDLPDRMQRFCAPGASLQIISKDSKGSGLLAINGDYSEGVLQVDPQNHASGFWLPADQWAQLCPGAAIRLGDQTFVRHDLPDRIAHIATQSKQLHIITPDYHGYQLMADEGDLSRGLLMVAAGHGAVGYWMPEEEHQRLVHDAQVQEVGHPAPSPSAAPGASISDTDTGPTRA